MYNLIRRLTPQHPLNLRGLQPFDLLEVPRTTNGSVAFDRMASAARRLSGALQARVVDDKRVPLTDSELKRIRAQLEEIYSRMAREGIAAGSPDALRLFSE